MNHFSAILLATTLTAGSAFAAGSATTTTTTPPAEPPKVLKVQTKASCPAGSMGKMLKNGKYKCKIKKVEGPSDKQLYENGYKLAKAGDYEKAIVVLSLVTDKNNPDVLNMLGYSNRKAGRIELGISYYAAALAQKPDFVKAREYLGEGYVAAGKIDLAKVQLAEIQKVCGTTCAEYKDLSKVIAGAVL